MSEFVETCFATQGGHCHGEGESVEGVDGGGCSSGKREDRVDPDGKKEEEGKPGDDNLALSRGRGVAA